MNVVKVSVDEIKCTVRTVCKIETDPFVSQCNLRPEKQFSYVLVLKFENWNYSMSANIISIVPSNLLPEIVERIGLIMNRWKTIYNAITSGDPNSSKL